jgi:hypothetical protein
VPVGIVYCCADEGAGVAAASDFAQLVRAVIEVGGGGAGFRFAAAVAVDVVAVGLGGAVARRGDSVEVVVEVAPGLGAGVDDLGLARAPALLVEAVEVAR